MGQEIRLAKSPLQAPGRILRWIAVAALLMFMVHAARAAEPAASTAPAQGGTKPAPSGSAAPAAPAAPAPPAEIPLGEIAARATEVANLLNTLVAQSAPSPQIEAIARSLTDLSAKLDAHLASTASTLAGQPSLETLQSLQQIWQRRQTNATASLSILTAQANKLQDGLNQLAELEKTWKATGAAAQKSNAPAPILQQIDATLAAIAKAEASLQNVRSVILDVQSRVASEVAKCGAALAQIGQFQQKAVAGIFAPDAPPIWRLDLWADAIAHLPEHVRNVTAGHRAALVSYVRDPGEDGLLHGVVFIAGILLFVWGRGKIRQWKKAGVPVSPALAVFDRPYAAAMTTVLFMVTSPFFQLPNTVRQLLIILVLWPTLRVVRPTMSDSIAVLSYAFCFLFAIDILRQAFAGIQLVGQTILVAETLAAIVALVWLRSRYRQFIAERADSSRLILFRLGRAILTLTLIVAFLAGASGYVRLARLLTPGILVGGTLALGMFAFVRVGVGLVALAFRLWPLRLLHMVEHHQELITRRIHTILVWASVLAWLARYLSYLGLFDPTWDFIRGVFSAKIERGTLSISVGNVIEFILTVWLSYLISRFIRFVLQEDLYPRIALAPGLSYAVSSLLNYIILALGFVAALAILGVDFSKVSLLAGAFGVGIGFGLQSVVNNFVSGLILLFERPIHVGDMVQVGGLQGRVRRIGIRASIIRTLQGSEIIVPNANLITQEVTNWTLSDQLRRIDLPVGVAYGSAPRKIIDLLEGVARQHALVLKDPPPRALFLAYGDSSIDFELRAWCEYPNWQQVHSDLTVAVYDAVYAAGMSFPFPQREVRLLSDRAGDAVSAQASSVVGKDGGAETKPAKT